MQSFLKNPETGVFALAEVSFTTGVINSFSKVWTQEPVTIAQAAVYTGTCIVGGMYLGKYVHNMMVNRGQSFAGFGN